MVKGTSLIIKKKFFQKKDNSVNRLLLSPILLIPLFLVIISSFLIKSIQRDLIASDSLSHLLTGLLGYVLAFLTLVSMRSGLALLNVPGQYMAIIFGLVLRDHIKSDWPNPL